MRGSHLAASAAKFPARRGKLPIARSFGGQSPRRSSKWTHFERRRAPLFPRRAAPTPCHPNGSGPALCRPPRKRGSRSGSLSLARGNSAARGNGCCASGTASCGRGNIAPAPRGNRPASGAQGGRLAVARKGEQRCARERMLRIGNGVLRTREHRGGAARGSPRKAGLKACCGCAAGKLKL